MAKSSFRCADRTESFEQADERRNGISFGSAKLRWLRKLAGRVPQEAPAEPTGPEDWLREGHDRELSGDLAEAERLYRQVIDAKPNHAEAHWFLGRLAQHDQRREEAIALFQQAVDLEPEEAIYWFHLGNALLALRYFQDAGEAFAAGCRLQPGYADVQVNLAAALIEQNRREEVRIMLERLREIHPDLWQVHFNLGGIYREYGRIAESAECYRRCLELVPDHPTSRSNLLLIMNYGSDYTAREIFEEHKKFGEQFARPYVVPQFDRAWPRRLRVGYISPDFRGHVVSYFLEPLLANHDHQAFEVFCYHNHPEKDGITERLRGYADHWRDCETWTDAELEKRIREDRIDILVDLAGHTAETRLLVFAAKPAPVQATYLGYPNTTGLAAVDYHITDAYADPPEDDALSIERKARVPGTYFCYRQAKVTPEPGRFPARGAGTITFGCFNNFPKISPAFVTAVARILKAVPGSRLLMKSRPLSVESVVTRLRERFAAHGIGPDQLDLRGWEAGYRDHLRIYHEVDVALDSFPYNGATTTCEALWMGVPVVTVAGDRHAGRMGSSLLHAVGLEELIAKDADEYVEKCRALAADPGRIEALRADLRGRMERSPLRDEAGFARKMEALYRDMWEAALRRESVPVATQPDEDLVALARRRKAAGALVDADAAVRRALAVRPDHEDALRLLCEISFDAGTPGAAVEPLVRAIAASSEVPAFHYLLGAVLQEQGKLDDALACLRRALELDPRLAKAHYNLGNAYRQTGEIDRAMESIERAVALKPHNAEWRSNLSELQYFRWKFDAAIASLRIATRSDPKHRLAHINLGASLLMVGSLDEAFAAVRTAEALKSEPASAAWLLFAQHYKLHDPRSLYEAHVAWAERHAAGVARLSRHAARRAGTRGRLNIGYVSPDFRAHPVAHFIEPVIAAHDRDRFRVFCYATTQGEDETTRRIRSSCDFWRDLSIYTDDAASERIRADGIDILVDLAGHTSGGRPLVFARKPAPIQATWIGYPNTTGLSTIDYRLTDAIADPPGATEAFHVEKLARLAGGFLCYRPPEHAPGPGEPPALLNGAVTFGSFNTLPKVSDEMVALWAQMLKAQRGSRIVLKSFGLAAQSARDRVHGLFASQGIDRTRVTLLAPEASSGRHLERYQEIDIALDTFPYNGTTTTCEALWMGVPVVTLAGKTHVSRVGASLLSAARLPELVAETPDEYVAKALKLAGDLQRLRTLRSALRDRLLDSRLLDAKGLTRELEGHYVRMADHAALGSVAAV
jgi:predicted O-linked N-acetylglucosamine transferase (SPINDLY family)